MLNYTTNLKEYNIDATDGEMGKIHDLYFDDEKWVIRYAIVDTRKWLPSKRVLLSPAAFENIDEQKKRVEVQYDKDKVKHSPSIPEETSISKDMEISLTGYYGWNRYWMGNMLWGVQDRPITHFHDDAVADDELRQELQMNQNKEDHGLRSVEEALEYKVHANNGKIGKVIDMVFDDEYWKIRYLVVHLERMPVGENTYTINPDDIQSVDWFEGDIYVNYKVEDLKQQRGYRSKDDLIADC